MDAGIAPDENSAKSTKKIIEIMSYNDNNSNPDINLNSFLVTLWLK